MADLEARGLLDSTLILMMGEFGRSPVINKDAGRDHWARVMSMVMAGGGLRHGQVFGSTDSKGYDIDSRRVAPGDLAATIFQHLTPQCADSLVSPWFGSCGQGAPMAGGWGAARHQFASLV